MSATMEKLSSNQVKLTITLSAETFEQGMNTAYHKLRGRLSVPGFRKGKAPRKVIENYYGQGVLVEEAFNTLLPDAYDGAVQETGIHPVDQPEVDVESIEPGKDCVFTATVYVRPDVTLGQYFGVEIPKVDQSVTDEDVENELKSAQERVSRWVDVERPAKNGDRVSVDYQGMVDGKPFEGGSSENFPLVLGSGTFIPGFEEQIVGMSKDEEKDIDVSFPEDYRATELAGKPAVFHVLVHEVKEKEVPELNDEFASEASEFETLDEYKADIRAKLEEQAKNRARNEQMDALIETVSANAQVDVPRPMVERQIDAMVNDMAMRMSYQGLKMEDFLKYTNQTMDDLRGQYDVQAAARVRAELVLDAIREAENIEATDEDVDKEIAKYAEENERSADELKETLSEQDKEYFKDMVVSQKVIDLLMEKAVEVEKKEEAPAEEAPAEEAPAEEAPAEEKGE